MELKDIYKESITREVNGVVSVTNHKKSVCESEIKEYVFTLPIVNGFYSVLNALKDRPYEQVGMWISGYYGSGKSHFIKYLNYCFDPEYRELALQRLDEAAHEFLKPDFETEAGNPSIQDWQGLMTGMSKMTIETCAVNLEQKDDKRIAKADSVLHILWKLFNEYRGLNAYDIQIALILERPLQAAGVLPDFKNKVKETLKKDWDVLSDRVTLLTWKRKQILDIVKELQPDTDIEVLKKALESNAYPISIDAFAEDLKTYVDRQPANFRLMFLVDEVSAFLANNTEQYLNLQELVARIAEVTDKKVWIACTAQQDLSEILHSMAARQEDEGKILGRFPVIVSLESTKIDYITQKRILEKNAMGAEACEELYKENSEKINAAFRLPAAYDQYKNADDFVHFYPIVPFQFTLMKKVLDNFQTLQFVATQVKGNERSIIRIIHDSAKRVKDAPLGRLIAFDEFYKSMFDGYLQPVAVNARTNADNIAKHYSDPVWATRVVNVLFMVCNLSDTEKLVFPASLDNLANLFVNDIDSNRAILKDELVKVLDFLCDNNVIRKEPAKGQLPEIYCFYSEEEINIANAIKSQRTDNDIEAVYLDKIIQEYFTSISNKVSLNARSFSVGNWVGVKRIFGPNANVDIEFKIDDEGDAGMVAMRNYPNRLVFYMGRALAENHDLRNKFTYFCKANEYMKNTSATNEENGRLRDEFSRRALAMKNETIAPTIREILDTCPVIAQTAIIDDSELGNRRGNERFKAAMQILLDRRYDMANLVKNCPHTSAELLAKIKNPDAVLPGTPLSPAEKEVETYLLPYTEKNVADIVAYFAKEPYGWDEIATLFVVNQLVVRHQRDYTYKNQPNVELSTVMANLIRSKADFALRPAQEIPIATINAFKDAWKEVFGPSHALSSTDSTQLVRTAKGSKEANSGLWKLLETYRDYQQKAGQYPFFRPVMDAIKLFQGWYDVRDKAKFFETVTAEKDRARELRDQCEAIFGFIQSQLDKYKKLIDYVRRNQDNFTFVPEDKQELVAKIRTIETKEWPIKLSEYVELKQDIDDELQDIRRSLRKQIKDAYLAAYKQLCEGAEAEGVSIEVIPKPEDKAEAKCLTDNIFQLRSNLDTHDYFKAGAAAIYAAKPKPKPVPPTPPGPGPKPAPGPEPKPSAIVVDLNLNTRTVSVLTNETEVNAYLDKLKSQIMAEINNNHHVKITR